MPWWVAMIIGAVSVFVFDIFKTILNKLQLKPFLRNAIAFALTMLAVVLASLAIRYIFFTPVWE